ncbi:MAG: histidinol dehydrogenase [Acidimicrobiales bacterium]
MLKRRVWAIASAEERDWLASRGAAGAESDQLKASIAALVEDVRQRGDTALCEALQQFDGVEVGPADLAVTAQEFATAKTKVNDALLAAIRQMIHNIRAFNEALMQRRSSWTTEIAPGHTVGETISPVASAAVFCPSGKASYPSVLAQVATAAVVAGVPELIVIVPPVPGMNGEVDPAVLVVAQELGIDRVFRVNGPAGIAAAAFGTDTIAKVGTIIGPGSSPVALAQLEVRRHGIESVVLGPSESLIIADSTADPKLLAADLLNEAEHGTDSTVLLVTTDEDLITATDAECEIQAESLPAERRAAALAALGSNGGALLVDDFDTAFEVANWFASEHVQLAIADPWASVDRIVHAGEVLVGQSTPLSAGNFAIGAPAALPTGRFARHTSGITVETFQKATSIGHLTPTALSKIATATMLLAEHEGFPAHVNAIAIRDNI